MSRASLLSGAAVAPALITRRDTTFSGDLTFEDRRRLRAIVLKTMPFLFLRDDSNVHVDQVIDSLGPEAMRKVLMRKIAAGAIG